MACVVWVVTLLAFLGGSAALDAGSLTAAEKNRPVSKVLTLLKDMVGTLEKEAKEDEEVFQTMQCWCETGRVTKTQAIDDNTQKIDQLRDHIEQLTANSARLTNEIATLNKEVAENEEALESATAMRQKELAEFSTEETDMLSSIGSMKGAITALSKHNGASFLQASSSVHESSNLVHSLARARAALAKHAALVSEVATPDQRRAIASLAQSEYMSGAAHNPEYAPQSGAIFGMLGGMKEGFEGNLAKSQKEEAQNQADYEALKKAKDSEIAAGKDLANAKAIELASTDEKNAQAQQDLKDTENTLAADSDFLANLKEQCKNVDAEYEERKKTRLLEIKATSEALAYLNSDDAKDLYSRTFSFVQKEQRQSSSRYEVSRSLARAAARARDPRLSLLAAEARQPQKAFDEVRKSLQAMISELTAEKEEEIKHKDFCVDAIQQNEKDTDHKRRVKADHQAVIDDLQTTIAQLTSEIAALKKAIADLQVQLKRAGEDREKQNKDFQTTVADQRATAKLLTGALDILKGFYSKAALVQAPAGPPPPAGFKKYEKSSSSGGVMGMIEQIIADAEAMVADALKAEEDAQVAYESFVKETNASFVAMQKDITSKMSDRGKAEAELEQKKLEFEAVVEELEELKSANEDLHSDCDWTLANFDARQGARDNEIQALKEAISIFSGATR